MSHRVCLLGDVGASLPFETVERSLPPGDLAGCDCVVAAAAGEPESLARELGSLSVPAVVVVDEGTDAGPLVDHVAVVRRGEGFEAALERRIEELTGRPRADGGVGVADPSAPFERMTDGIVTLSGGRVTYLNDAAARTLSVDRETARGERLADLEGVEGSVIDRTVGEARESGEVATAEAHYEPLGGWLEVRAYPDEDGLSVFLRDVTEGRRAKDELAASEAAVRRLHETVSDTDLSAAEKLDRILEIGRDRLGTEVGILSHIEDGRWEAVACAGDHPAVEEGLSVPASESYCRKVIDGEGPLAVLDAVAEGWADDPAYDRWGVSCYMGAAVEVNGEPYGTVCFADSEPRRWSFTESEEAFVELLTDWVRYVLELEHEQAFIQSLLDSLPDPLYAFDDDGRLVRWNDRLTTVTGYDPGEVAGMDALSFIAPEDRERVAAELDRVRAGERISVEADIRTAAGDHLPYEMSGAPIVEDGEVVGATGVARDIGERRAHQEMLSGLLEATGSLMQGRDREEVAEVVATAAQSVLGFDITLVRLYDSEAGTLVPAAHTEGMSVEMGERPVYEVGEGVPGEVFASGEPRAIGDVTETEIPNHGNVRSLLCQPMGVHGTISVGATEPDAFDGTDRQVLALLATSAAAACTRAKREQEVREAREHTETVLDRINGLIENTVEVLVKAGTREELAEGVVAELAAADPYAFAWIGGADVTGETLTPDTWAGDPMGDEPVSELAFDLEADGPVATAYRTGEPQVVTDVTAVGDLPWAAGMLVPLVYKGTTYGVMAVFADERGAFDEREQVVLDALGRAIANAINAIERGRIIEATEIIELEFTVDDPDLLFCRLSGAADRVETAGIDYRADGSLRLYLTAEGVGGEELATLAREDDSVAEAVVIADHDGECLLELTVSESVLATLAEFGAAPQTVVGEGGTTRLTVELPYEAEAREVFELVEQRYPSTELAGYHERERPVETRQEFRATLADRFTDRQETALRTAYLGGFFDWPRGVDGNELAEAMDIARPTYHQHLRAAQRKVFEELFE